MFNIHPTRMIVARLWPSSSEAVTSEPSPTPSVVHWIDLTESADLDFARRSAAYLAARDYSEANVQVALVNELGVDESDANEIVSELSEPVLQAV